MLRRQAAVLALIVLLGACNNDTSPIDPGPVEPPPVGAPVITSLAAGTIRAEVDDEVTVTAQVAPGEGAGTLTYQWSATVGTVTGTGPTATWSLDGDTVKTPTNVVVSLTVVKPYQARVDGQIVNREHRVTEQAEPFRLHDSEAEVSTMVLHFLVDLFGDSRKSADQCLVDFWPDCPGTALEHADIEKNRKERRILNADAEIADISFNGTGTAGLVWADCTFEDEDRATGVQETYTGDCRLDVVYHDARWWICSSTFENGRQIKTVDPSLGPGSVTVSGYWRSRAGGR